MQQPWQMHPHHKVNECSAGCWVDGWRVTWKDVGLTGASSGLAIAGAPTAMDDTAAAGAVATADAWIGTDESAAGETGGAASDWPPETDEIAGPGEAAGAGAAAAAAPGRILAAILRLATVEARSKAAALVSVISVLTACMTHKLWSSDQTLLQG